MTNAPTFREIQNAAIDAIRDTYRANPVGEKEIASEMRQAASFAAMIGISGTQYLRWAMVALRDVAPARVVNAVADVYFEAIHDDE